MKRCSKCKMKLSISDFYQRKKGPRAGEYYEKCKECMKLRGRQYYHDNRERQLSLALVRRHRAYIEKRNFISKIKDKSCTDCGIKYPYYVMDLNHRKGTEKINDVSYMTTRNWSLDKIKKEAEKCEVVCANCHRIRTYKYLNKLG